MIYNVSSGTLNPTIPYQCKLCPHLIAGCCHLANLMTQFRDNSCDGANKLTDAVLWH